MQTEKYCGYTLWGHAILRREDIVKPERFAGSGTVTRYRGRRGRRKGDRQLAPCGQCRNDVGSF
jgi:hypothetical protein